MEEGIETSYKHVLTDRVFATFKGIGCPKLDFILVTHTHSDHIGNVDELLRSYPVGRIYMKKYSDSRITTPTHLWDNLYGYDKVYRLLQKRCFSYSKHYTREMLIFSLGTWIFNSITMKMKLIHQVN